MEETMNLKDWAKREVDLATKDEEMNEILKIYEAAYQIFCDFLKRVEGFENLGLIKSILIQLLYENPLTPIEDNEEDWTCVGGIDPTRDHVSEYGSSKIYQCKRRSSLFREVRYNKLTHQYDINYNDLDRAICIDINSQRVYFDGMGLIMLNEMLPISLPYCPVDKIKVYTEDFKAYESDEDFDTVGVLYFKLPDGQMIEVKRFFKKTDGQMVEIDKTEYFARKRKAEALKTKGDAADDRNDNR